jgi:hypothetical protein
VFAPWAADLPRSQDESTCASGALVRAAVRPRKTSGVYGDLQRESSRPTNDRGVEGRRGAARGAAPRRSSDSGAESAPISLHCTVK